MNRANAALLLPVIQGFIAGQVIEYFDNGLWIETDNPDFDLNTRFRTKAQPRTFYIELSSMEAHIEKPEGESITVKEVIAE